MLFEGHVKTLPQQESLVQLPNGGFSNAYPGSRGPGRLAQSSAYMSAF